MSARPFDCSRCGACCRLVSEVPQLAHLDRGDGACVHMRGEHGGEHGCAIYADRPALCRVDDARPRSMSVATWHKLNADACQVLRLRVYGEEPRHV